MTYHSPPIPHTIHSHNQQLQSILSPLLSQNPHNLHTNTTNISHPHISRDGQYQHHHSTLHPPPHHPTTQYPTIRYPLTEADHQITYTIPPTKRKPRNDASHNLSNSQEQLDHYKFISNRQETNRQYPYNAEKNNAHRTNITHHNSTTSPKSPKTSDLHAQGVASHE